jgi:hypothetical protein
MSGDGASVLLLGIGAFGALLFGVLLDPPRPKTALAVGLVFAFPALVRLWIAAVAS